MSRVRPLFIRAARLAVAGLFLAACIAKIRDPEAFALAVSRYRILPGEKAVFMNPLTSFGDIDAFVGRIHG